MRTYLTDDNAGTKTERYDIKAGIRGAFLALPTAIVFGVGVFYIFCAPFFAAVAIISGIVDMTITGFNFWNIFWVLAGVVFFRFYRPLSYS